MNESLLTQLYANEKNMAVAVSGGVDSVCLLHMCSVFAKAHKKALYAFHVHHGLRKESDGEEQFVKQLAKSLGAKFVCVHLDVMNEKAKTKTTTEEAARALRYSALKEMAAKNNVKHICLAHNQNDQAETLLLHIIRGSGLKGACAMQEVSGIFVRPLLQTSRKEIELYAKANNLEHVEDTTNADIEFSRNFVRHKILPELEKLQNGATERIAKFTAKMKEVDEFVENNTPKLEKSAKNEVKLTNFNLPKFIFARQVYNACNLLGVFQDIEEKHIEAVFNLNKKQTGTSINLTHGLVAWKTADGVVLTAKASEVQTKQVAFNVGEFEICGTRLKLEKTNEVEFGNGSLYLDYFKIPDNAVFRFAKEGDRFTKLGAKGGKKLSDYFTDKKIPRHNRKNIVVLASGSEILAVVGYDISEKVKIDEETEDIIKISIQEK